MLKVRKLTQLIYLILVSQVAFSLDVNSDIAVKDSALKDKNLQACIVELAQKNQWVTVAAVTEIECHNKHIASLTGIEIFTRLQKLSLFNNDITDATLLTLPHLRVLNLAKNKMAKIHFGDLPALEELYLFGNKLTQLELPPLPQLKQLKANENGMTNFLYQDLPKLEKIYLFSNKLLNMDIYHLPLAHYIDVRQNPMPDKLYQEMDKLKGITFLHDGNAKEWQ